MDADGQSTAFASRAHLDASGDRFRFLDNPLRGVEEFLTCRRWPGATVRSFEENCSKLMLKVTQAPTERRLPDIESRCCPPKAFVLSCDNSPAQRSKFNAHRVFHASMRNWPLRLLVTQPRPSVRERPPGQRNRIPARSPTA